MSLVRESPRTAPSVAAAGSVAAADAERGGLADGDAGVFFLASAVRALEQHVVFAFKQLQPHRGLGRREVADAHPGPWGGVDRQAALARLDLERLGLAGSEIHLAV